MAINRFSELLDNPSHHAFLVLGDRTRNYEELSLLARSGAMADKLLSVDIWSRAYESVGIDDAREIKEIQNTKPIGAVRMVLISFLSMQGEAQNSLLKLFEEPSSQTIFIICAESSEIFLPTLLSRFYIIDSRGGRMFSAPVSVSGPNLASRPSLNSPFSVAKFLSGTVQERLNLIEPLVKDKDKTRTGNFLNDLELTLHQSMNSSTNKDMTAIFEAILSARRFLRSRSPSIKMILDNLCVIAPAAVIAEK